MKNLKTILAATALAASSFFTPATAGTRGDYAELVDTLQAAGFTFEVNARDCKNDIDGFYSGRKRRVVICQDKSYAGGPLRAFTANDLDTIRHEVHHVVQDCMDRRIGNGGQPVYNDPEELITDQLSTRQIKGIISSYARNGVDRHQILNELEAFAVADMNDVREQIKDIRTYCFK